MTPRIEMFGYFSNIKHATSTTGNTVDEMGGGARESVLDVVGDLKGRYSNRGIIYTGLLHKEKYH